MTTTDYITDTGAQLTEWGIDYRETDEGLSVGNIHLEITEERGRPVGTILNGSEVVATTSDADKAAALLAFPLARRAWGLGYVGDFEVTVFGGEVEMRLTYSIGDVTISAGIDEADRFTITEHGLLDSVVVMSDLDAALTSTQLAYGNPDEAWQVLCGASDFSEDHWENIVEFFSEDVHITHGARFTKVESCVTERIAIVDDCDPELPTRVIDVESAEDTTQWAMSDVAAAVLCAIS